MRSSRQPVTKQAINDSFIIMYFSVNGLEMCTNLPIALLIEPLHKYLKSK